MNVLSNIDQDLFPLRRTVLGETGSGKILPDLSSNEDTIWWPTYGRDIFFLKPKMVQNSLGLVLNIFILYLSKSVHSNAHLGLCKERLLGRCMKDIRWSQRWTRFDLPQPILAICWKFGIKKSTPPCILAFWGWSFCNPVDPQNWMLCWPPFPLPLVAETCLWCASGNRFPVRYKIQETFQCKASWTILTSLLLSIHSLSAFFCSVALALQCLDHCHGSAVSRPFPYPQR